MNQRLPSSLKYFYKPMKKDNSENKIETVWKELEEICKSYDECFGIGIGEENGKEIIIIYVVNSPSRITKFLSDKKDFKGFPLKIRVTGEIIPAWTIEKH